MTIRKGFVSILALCAPMMFGCSASDQDFAPSAAQARQALMDNEGGGGGGGGEGEPTVNACYPTSYPTPPSPTPFDANPSQWLRDAHRWAAANGHWHAFPNYHKTSGERYTDGPVRGTVTIPLTAGGVWREVFRDYVGPNVGDLNGAYLDDFKKLFPAVQAYAESRGFAAGISNGEQGIWDPDGHRLVVYGVQLLPVGAVEVLWVPWCELGNANYDDVSQMFRATAYYAARRGRPGAYPTFQSKIQSNIRYERVVLFRNETASWRDVKVADLMETCGGRIPGSTSGYQAPCDENQCDTGFRPESVGTWPYSTECRPVPPCGSKEGAGCCAAPATACSTDLALACGTDNLCHKCGPENELCCTTGDACLTGLVCSSDSKCRVPPLGSEGAACRSGFACDAGLACRNNSTNIDATNGVCRKLPDPIEAPNPSVQCSSSLITPYKEHLGMEITCQCPALPTYLPQIRGGGNITPYDGTPYQVGADPCVAAVHAGAIPAVGGQVTLKMTRPRAPGLPGGLRNNITADGYTHTSWFTFGFSPYQP